MSISGTNEFGTALRGWRNRRRVSQIDLANGAGTTQRHVSFLEQGRSAPGRDIVTRLADSLQLTLREGNALLSAAGFAPEHPESPPDAPMLEEVRQALQHVLDGHMPYPAMVMDGFGELVGANNAFGLLTEDVAPWLLAPPINVLRIALHPDGMAPRIVNLDDWRRHILHGMRQRGPHPRIDALIEELEGYGVPAPDRQPSESLGFAVPLHLRSSDGDVRLVATISTFVTALDVTVAELRLEAFLPADRDTTEILFRRNAVRH
ncbi:XRE family transcriptional regulator [Mycolicibacterium sp. P9-64]|uniref:helix-turn-helix domain-containing protein n=1 Tax=Mycolicibacterium sp. P9-64 TaxID=2024612 RepID=UPI0011ECD9FC|nr:helix-turn-helix transcriptional regulator [Mycolicibacterium sp. P9-64]KAA0083377.1 XRE family transcriptional regulator [Mycolicibacterium sp. P9-64]